MSKSSPKGDEIDGSMGESPGERPENDESDEAGLDFGIFSSLLSWLLCSGLSDTWVGSVPLPSAKTRNI